MPDGSDGAPLRLAPAEDGQVRLEWGPSCSPSTDGYAVYEGNLDQLRTGVWNHLPVTCDNTDQARQLTPGAGNRYFLIAPTAGSTEGDYGLSSSGEIRPQSVSACAVRQAGTGCDSM